MPSIRGAVDSLANSRGRSMQHVFVGLGLTVGAVALSALVARLNDEEVDITVVPPSPPEVIGVGAAPDAPPVEDEA